MLKAPSEYWVEKNFFMCDWNLKSEDSFLHLGRKEKLPGAKNGLRVS
jgi:hypothetical protein